jgi:monoamine oxidase
LRLVVLPQRPDGQRAAIARQLFGDNISPVEVRTSSWSTDRYARGAYSFHAPGSRLDDRRLDNPATVHGAVLSGQYAAADLMRRLR